MKKKISVAWKRNLRKIPTLIKLKINSFESNEVVVSCVKKIPTIDIAEGKYAHIKLRYFNDNVEFPNEIIPNPNIGKYSRINIEGDEIVRKDLPMITKTYVIETPNYGDWSYGSHDVYRDRDVYIRDYLAPKLLDLQIKMIGKEAEKDVFIFRFTVDEVLNRKQENFYNELLYNLNLLQENTGMCDVFKEDATIDDYLKTIYVNWEILPPDTREDNISTILSKYKNVSDKTKKKFLERYDLLEKLKPIAFINGTSGFRRYFGAKFADDLVVFENLEYGNAIYVMYENWEELSQKTRMELMSGSNKEFDRIVHGKGWKTQLKYLVKSKL